MAAWGGYGTDRGAVEALLGKGLARGGEDRATRTLGLADAGLHGHGILKSTNFDRFKPNRQKSTYVEKWRKAMQPEETEVLIVGAGPTGLALAATLAAARRALP